MLSVVWGRRRDLERNFWEEEGTYKSARRRVEVVDMLTVVSVRVSLGKGYDDE